MQTEIVAAELESSVSRAVELLDAGQVVALPTETVYGLAADALNPEAVARIFEAKERPRFDPLIVHLPEQKALDQVSEPETNIVPQLTQAFWPGPLTIVLRKREAYRRAFADFDPEKVARFTQKRAERLVADPGIIRNRLKIMSAITNARRFLDVQEEFSSFDKYIWRFVDGRPIQNRLAAMTDLPATSNESDVLSKDLKQRGFKFVGSTIVYAHMQAIGMVNDHLVTCFRHKAIARLR